MLLSPFTSIKDVLDNFPVVGSIGAAMWGGNLFKSIDVIDQISCPLLIIHGSVDDMVYPVSLLYQQNERHATIVCRDTEC